MLNYIEQYINYFKLNKFNAVIYNMIIVNQFYLLMEASKVNINQSLNIRDFLIEI